MPTEDQKADISFYYKKLKILWQKEEREIKEVQEKYQKLVQPYLEKIKEIEH